MTIYRIEIDRSLCSGFAACVYEAAEVFRVDDSVAVAASTSTDPRVLDAALACPASAITAEEVLDEAA